MTDDLHPLMRAAIRARAGDCDPWEFALRSLAPHLGPADRLIGHGGEGFVYAGSGRITKFILNWTHPARDLPQTAAWLRDLAARAAGAVHIYAFDVECVASDLLAIRYPAEPGTPLTNASADADWLSVRPQLIACFAELAAAGFGHTNPRPSNFVWDRDRLMLVDYGCDCRPLAEAAGALARMQFMWSAGFYDRGEP
jgi:hypothetical protein